jgi:predicted RNA methylase
VTTHNRQDESMEQRFARLRDETFALAPPGDLAARIAAQAKTRSRRSGLSAVVLPFGRGALAAAALAAAASIVLAIQTEASTEDAVADIDGVTWEP